MSIQIPDRPLPDSAYQTSNELFDRAGTDVPGTNGRLKREELPDGSVLILNRYGNDVVDTGLAHRLTSPFGETFGFSLDETGSLNSVAVGNHQVDPKSLGRGNVLRLVDGPVTIYTVSKATFRSKGHFLVETIRSAVEKGSFPNPLPVQIIRRRI